MWDGTKLLVTFGTMLLIPAIAARAGAAFDCGKVGGQVEKLICADAALAVEDGKLDVIYSAAAATAKGAELKRLEAEQRGWIKGRNECWKSADAATWLTASWIVKSVRDCVAGQYAIRGSELQAVWRLLPPKSMKYACQGQAADEIVANYFDTTPPTARLERGGRSVTLWHVPGAAEGAYEGPNVTLARKGEAAAVSWMNASTGETEALECVPH